MEKTYYLYLDESGDFKTGDKKRGANSVVAGYITEKKLSGKQADKLFAQIQNSKDIYKSLKPKPFHGIDIVKSENEEEKQAYWSYVTDFLSELCEKEITLVQFIGNYNGNAGDSDWAYLDVFTEGIIKLGKKLLATCNPSDSIKLEVLYAHRIYSDTKEQVEKKERIEEEEYKKRLEKKLAISMAHLAESTRKRFSYNIKTDNATKDSCLMIADMICFALRGGKYNFSEEQQARISKLRAHELKVLDSDNDKWTRLQDFLIEGRLSDAIYYWYLSYYEDLNKKKETKARFYALLEEYLCTTLSVGRRIQFTLFSGFVKTLVDLRMLNLADKLLDRLEKDFYPWLERLQKSRNERWPEVEEFIFDMFFFRLTTANHEGDTAKEIKYMNCCRERLSAVPITFEKMDYYLRYRIREVEHFKNIFDFKKALSVYDDLEQIYLQMKECMELVDCLDEFGENMKYSELGKVFNGRAATYGFLTAYSPEQKTNALKDIQAALKEFSLPLDISRVYQNEAMIYYNGGEYDNALLALKKAVELPKDASVDIIMQTITSKVSGPFCRMHYAHIMGKAAIAGNGLADSMYAAWCKYYHSDILEEKDLNHPTEIIAWRLGTVNAVHGNKDAEKYYNFAANISLAVPENFTIYAIGLAIKAEQLALTDCSKREKAINTLIEYYDKFTAQELPDCMRAYFGEWEQTLAVAAKEKDIEKQKKMFLKLSAGIPIL